MRKPKYPEAEKTIQNFFLAVSDSFQHPAANEVGENGKKKQEIVADEFSISRMKVRKILVTTGDLCFAETEMIRSLIQRGLKVPEISEQLNMSRSTINSYIPYGKGVYKLAEVSAAAERTALYRVRKERVKQLTEALESDDWKDALWNCVIAFEKYPFFTSGRGSRLGVKFSYAVSQPGQFPGLGRMYRGNSIEGYGNEIIISTKSGTISRSTVERAVVKAIELGGAVKGPKMLNVPGAHSYLYPMLIRFGIVLP